MITTYKVMLLVIMCVTLMGFIGDNDKDKAVTYASICIASMLAVTSTLLWM